MLLYRDAGAPVGQWGAEVWRKALVLITTPLLHLGMCRWGWCGGRHAPNSVKCARKLVKIQSCCRRVGHSIFRDCIFFSKNSWSIGQTPPNGKCLSKSLIRSQFKLTGYFFTNIYFQPMWHCPASHESLRIEGCPA